ncbi:hypothetical protein OHI65_07085 [Brucella sp. MAB-22]|uniref:hypothetical protein n=1 Tax=Brucella sp. MAB-22 TaxID=2986424 RepID=UPI0022211EF7|nr:hypothetical protein [Brucella sp. MAB-22]UYT54138.1 hypothetical protein OHI65_07085 [Brucella sp. MAB-22]
MEREDFQANWRGARRYQFDDEVRIKSELLKGRDRTWLDRLPVLGFILLVAIASAAAFVAMLLLSVPPI